MVSDDEDDGGSRDGNLCVGGGSPPKSAQACNMCIHGENSRH